MLIRGQTWEAPRSSDGPAGSRHTVGGRVAATDTRASQDRPGGKLLPESSDQAPAAPCCSSAEPVFPKSPTKQLLALPLRPHGGNRAEAGGEAEARRRGPLRTAGSRCPVTLSVQSVAQHGRGCGGAGHGIRVVGVMCQPALFCNYRC